MCQLAQPSYFNKTFRPQITTIKQLKHIQNRIERTKNPYPKQLNRLITFQYLLDQPTIKFQNNQSFLIILHIHSFYAQLGQSNKEKKRKESPFHLLQENHTQINLQHHPFYPAHYKIKLLTEPNKHNGKGLGRFRSCSCKGRT